MISWTLPVELARGTFTTMVISLAGIAAGMLIGLPLALLRTTRLPVLTQAIAIYISMIRATPVVALALLVFFGLPAVGLAIGPFAAGILTLTINTSVFQAEIWRAQLNDFPRGQREAAYAAGMTDFLAFRRIIFPQIWRAALPALVNEMTLLLKGSPAVAVIGVVDLTRVAVRMSSVTYEPVKPFLLATLIYIVIVIALIAAQRTIENTLVRKYGIL
jgi:His/Glu/Gln/Arg/opine family amino acid ABC transporter permease subunit